MNIEFGSGPVGYREDKDEKIREVVEKINKETEAAGLPWWAGMFNPELVKLASSAHCECNCAKPENERNERGGADETTEETPEAKQFREMEEQRERNRRADELVIKAIRVEISGMEKLEELLESTDTKDMAVGDRTLVLECVRNIAKAGSAVARLRGSMTGVPFYGYGV